MKETYSCAVCNKIYDTIEERSQCETQCLKERTKAEEALKQQKLKEEKNKRKEEIKTKWDELIPMMTSYIEDYGSIQLGEKRFFNDDFFPSNKLFGWWF